MYFNSLSNCFLGFQPSVLNLESFKAYLTSCPGLTQEKSI